jgi:hypothetical protein
VPRVQTSRQALWLWLRWSHSARPSGACPTAARSSSAPRRTRRSARSKGILSVAVCVGSNPTGGAGHYWGRFFEQRSKMLKLQHASLTCSSRTKRASSLPIPARSATSLSTLAVHRASKATVRGTVSFTWNNGIAGRPIANGGCPLGGRGWVPAQPPRDGVMAAAGRGSRQRSPRLGRGREPAGRCRASGRASGTGIRPGGHLSLASCPGAVPLWRVRLGCTRLRPPIMVTSVGRTAAGAGAEGVHGFAPVLTSFVGRATALSAVAGLLGDYRLVTVTGPGGSARPGWRVR